MKQNTHANLEAVEQQTDQVACCGFDLVVDRFASGHDHQVLMLHGLGGNRLTWRDAGRRMAAELRATVWAIDLPGFGASRTHGRRLDLKVLLEVIRTFAHKVGQGGLPWIVCGNSLGGTLAMALAAEEPLVVNRLILSAVALPLRWGRTPPSLKALGRFLPLAMPGLGRRLMTRYVLRTGVPGVVDDPVRLLFGQGSVLDPVLRAELIELSKDRMTWCPEASLALEHVTFHLGLALLARTTRHIEAVRCRVTSIYGDQDPLYPVPAWDRLRHLRPDWEHICLSGLGHLPQMEAPPRFVRAALAS